MTPVGNICQETVHHRKWRENVDVRERSLYNQVDVVTMNMQCFFEESG